MEEHLLLYLILMWQIILPQVKSQAPGDEDSFCTTLSSSIIPPFYPPNSVILMDSYNYLQLIPVLNPNSGVWQQVDIDGRLGGTGGASIWQQVSSSACRQRMSSCHFNTDLPAQDNWLITQHISRDRDVPQVSIQVEFELTGCEAGCQVSFLSEVWETSTFDRTQARNTSNYRRVQRVSPNQDSGLVSQNASIPVDFNTNETGFYLAFVDDNTCIAITRIIVFYYVCPAMTLDLVIYPEILSPPIDNSGPQSKTVTGMCVNDSSGELRRNPPLQCIQAGKWGTLQEGTGCQCNPGFVAVEDVEECATCPAGQYVSPSNGSCQPCPANTQVDQKGVPICQCLGGYFRADGESADFPCTQPPGEPTDIIVRREGTTAFLSWKAPSNTGGRTDIFYTLWYQPQGGERMVGNRVNGTMGLITDLQPNRRYRFFVSAENGVSSMPVLVLGLDEFSNDNTALIAGIMVALVVVIVLTLIFITVVLYVRRGKSSRKPMKSWWKKTTKDEGSNKILELPKLQSHYSEPKENFDNMIYKPTEQTIPDSLIISSRLIELRETFGQGEFGIVYKGYLQKSPGDAIIDTVAVKTLKGFVDQESINDLIKECIKMQDFDHPNILKLIGVCLDGGPAPYIIMPYMVNGDLLSFLKKKRAELVILQGSRDSNDAVNIRKKLLDMFHQVGKGMQYLASKRVIHRDLAARNCMIDLHFVIKVADFGLAESMDLSKEYYRPDEGVLIKLPIKWMSPESILDNTFSEKTDVWSYGITLWEICSGGQSPYPGIHPTELPRRLQSGYRMEIPLNTACSEDMYSLMTTCWENDPAKRPSFAEIVTHVSTLMLQVVDYLQVLPTE